MTPRPGWLFGPVAFLLAAAFAAGEEKSAPAKQPANNVASVVAKIDAHFAERWSDAKIKPAEAAEDAEFLRRVYLDLAGRIPSVEETRTFLGDQRPDRRERLVEQLLGSRRYVAHFTNVFKALLIPEAGNNFQVRLQQGGFEEWLKDQVNRNVGYDELARNLITAKVAGGFPLGNGGGASAVTYYLAKEFKPENLAASTARVFLGISVECAQCHNHPFAEWKREQFWGFAAFFAGIKSQRLQDFLLPGNEDAQKHEISMPGTEKVIQAKFLDGKEPAWKKDASARATLAEWVTAADNPYFARNVVNRMWAYFFGAGLIEPLDSIAGGPTTANNGELLDMLAREFAAHKFDLKFLMRVITATRAYQLSSASTHGSQEDFAFFARMPLRGLTAEQLFDSVSMATGYRDSGSGDDLISGLLGGQRSARSEFLTKFAAAERPTEAQTSILQALSLMNSKVVADATSLVRSEMLTAVVDAPFLDTKGRIETLYLATLSRKPEAKELERAVQFVRDAMKKSKANDVAGKQLAYSNALADVFWALLNNPEFIVNH